MAHEDLTRKEVVEGSSDRSFGLVFAAVFSLITFLPLLHGGAVRWWSLGVAALFGVLALVRPALLALPNRLWMKLGLLLGAIVSPIALGILFYLVFTPMGLAMRLFGKDPMRLRFEPQAASYWIRREPPGPPPQSMTQQF